MKYKIVPKMVYNYHLNKEVRGYRLYRKEGFFSSWVYISSAETIEDAEKYMKEDYQDYLEDVEKYKYLNQKVIYKDMP